MELPVPQGNPFSTRFVRPGALEFLFPPGEDVGQLVERLRQQGWWGALTGPHGAGKTTLLHTIIPHLQRAGKQVSCCTLKAGQRRLPDSLMQSRGGWDARSIVIVDGYEQLGFWARIRLKFFCRRSGTGLLVTSHARAGLPVLYAVRTSLETVDCLVELLLHQHPGKLNQPSMLNGDDVARGYQRWSGNVREVFFGLYDVYEIRRHNRQRTGGSSPSTR